MKSRLNLLLLLIFFAQSRWVFNTSSSMIHEDVISLEQHLQYAISEKTRCMNDLYLQYLRDFINKISIDSKNLPTFKKSETPSHKKCYDWRHVVHRDDYFKRKRSAKNLKRAADDYKMIIRISKLLEQIDKSSIIAKCYIECWLGPDINFLNLSILSEKLSSQNTHLVTKIDEEEIFDFVLSGDPFPGVTFTGNVKLVNDIGILFVYDHTLVKGQAINSSNTLHCVIFHTSLCPCKRWFHWTQPLYSYPLISFLIKANNGHLAMPFTPYFIEILSALISKRKNKGCLTVQQLKKFNLTSMIGTYHSGLQIIKDIWPGSDMNLVIYSRKNVLENYSLSNLFWKILYKPTINTLEIFLDENNNLMKLDGEAKLFLETMIKKTNEPDFAFFKPDLGQGHMNSIEDLVYSVANHNALTIQAYQLFGSQISQHNIDIFSLYNARLNQIFSFYNRDYITALNWKMGTWIKPTPTIMSILCLYNIMNLPSINNGIKLYSLFKILNTSKILLAGLLFYRSTARRREIWTDIFRRGHCKQYATFDIHDFENSVALSTCIKLVPFNFNILLNGILLFLYKDVQSKIFLPFDAKDTDGFYFWDKTVMSLPVLMV